MAEEELQANPVSKQFPFFTLRSVPIDDEYVELMTRILAEHGATLTETDEPPPLSVKGTPKMYAVAFPPGTTRSNGLVMMRSVPFILSFPDTYSMSGAELWPIQRHESDSCINVLYLAREEISRE